MWNQMPSQAAADLNDQKAFGTHSKAVSVAWTFGLTVSRIFNVDI